MGTLESNTIVKKLGIQPYEPIYQQMQSFQFQRTSETADEIWLLEHEPVFTLGRNGNKEHILKTTDIPIVPIDRGGQVTYHAPGQLILYTLIDFKRNNIGVKQWVNHLENSIIALLKCYQIEAKNDPNAPGVYVGGKKIAALGLRISRGCCYHGLSLNINMDLSPFNDINPCGYAGLEVTQCSDLGITASFQELQDSLLEKVLDLNI
jgi:lipoyl(octanoyl) transferase